VTLQVTLTAHVPGPRFRRIPGLACLNFQLELNPQLAKYRDSDSLRTKAQALHHDHAAHGPSKFKFGDSNLMFESESPDSREDSTNLRIPAKSAQPAGNCQCSGLRLAGAGLGVDAAAMHWQFNLNLKVTRPRPGAVLSPTPASQAQSQLEALRLAVS
jgi:hypothetical protein